MKTTITYCVSLSAICLVISFASCKKDETAAATIIAIDSTKTFTVYDSSTIFSNYKTVSLPDSVVVVNGVTVTKELNSGEEQYIQAFNSGLATKGFSVVNKTANPDLVLNITRIASTSDGMVDNTGYWSNYALFYDPTLYGEIGFSYIANLNTSTTVSDGALSFELLDIKDAAANSHISIVWDGLISGYALLSDTTAVQTETGIIFGKSPYLKAN